MEALGRLFNIVPTAAGVWVNLRNAQAVAFVLVGADTYTVQEAQDAAGVGAQNLTVIDHYYANANANGSTGWTRVDEDPAVAAIVVAAGVAVVEVEAASLSGGFGYVSCAGTTGLVYAIPHGLAERRDLTRLAAVSS